MRFTRLLPATFLLAISLTLLESGTGQAAFHCMRVHAVMAGYQGDGDIQYVELRMAIGLQTNVGGHTVRFYDGADVLKATFTFPGNVGADASGSSILIATQAFNDNTLGGNADVVFSGTNTVAANGGDPLHPVQSASGRVVFAEGSGGCTASIPVDSVAYGTATPDYGSAAVALPSPSTNRALRLNNLATAPTNNSTEYALETVASSTFTVATGSLKSDASTPRNNSGVVLDLVEPVGGIAEPPGLAVEPLVGDNGGAGSSVPVIAAGAAAVVAFVISIAAVGWYARRRNPARSSWWDEQT